MPARNWRPPELGDRGVRGNRNGARYRTLSLNRNDDRRPGRATIDDDIYLSERIVDAVPQGLHGILKQASTLYALHP